MDWNEIEEQQVPTYEEAIRQVGIRPGQRVLDIGCGAGTFLRLAAAEGALVHGLDAAESLVEVAQTKTPVADVRVGEMEALPWDDGYFDLVTGFNSFFYAANMVAALREAGRVTKPGGKVVIQVWGAPERCDLDALKKALAPLLPPPNPSAPAPPRLWEPGVLEEIASMAGLRPERTFHSSWAFRFPDAGTLVERMLAPGIVVEAVAYSGEEPVRSAILRALADFRRDGTGYWLNNEWLYLVAQPR